MLEAVVAGQALDIQALKAEKNENEIFKCVWMETASKNNFLA